LLKITDLRVSGCGGGARCVLGPSISRGGAPRTRSPFMEPTGRGAHLAPMLLAAPRPTMKVTGGVRSLEAGNLLALPAEERRARRPVSGSNIPSNTGGTTVYLPLSGAQCKRKAGRPAHEWMPTRFLARHQARDEASKSNDLVFLFARRERAFSGGLERSRKRSPAECLVCESNLRHPRRDRPRALDKSMHSRSSSWREHLRESEPAAVVLGAPNYHCRPPLLVVRDHVPRACPAGPRIPEIGRNRSLPPLERNDTAYDFGGSQGSDGRMTFPPHANAPRPGLPRCPPALRRLRGANGWQRDSTQSDPPSTVFLRQNASSRVSMRPPWGCPTTRDEPGAYTNLRHLTVPHGLQSTPGRARRGLLQPTAPCRLVGVPPPPPPPPPPTSWPPTCSW